MNKEMNLSEIKKSPRFLLGGKKLKIALGIMILLLVSVALALGLGWAKSSKNARYKTEKIRRGDLEIIVSATGTLQPTNSVIIGSELSGTIKSVEVDHNSRIKSGQVLARLCTEKIEAEVTQLKAGLQSAEARALEAQATVSEKKAKLAQLQQVRQLSKGRTPSQSEMNVAEADLERAKAHALNCAADVATAWANLQVKETEKSKSIIRSPINGIVLYRKIEPGQTVAASMTTPELFTLAEDLTKMDLQIDVDEADVGKVAEGQQATFSVAAYPNRLYKAKVVQTRNFATTTSGVVTYKAVLKLDNFDLSLRPGMTATADIITRRIDNALLVPSRALRFEPPPKEKSKSSGFMNILVPWYRSGDQKKVEDINKGNRIWLVQNNELSEVPVKIGMSQGGFTEVIEGDIKPGMAVAVDLIMEDK
ncbi:MAG: Macrolide export protein MacA [Syntrophus sp. SKADARSKE-3]|nr:Macrolide export protein MacA [Syntrophus sp. SKADARSKE-3]